MLNVWWLNVWWLHMSFRHRSGGVGRDLDPILATRIPRMYRYEAILEYSHATTRANRQSIQWYATIVNRTDTCDNRSSGMRQSIQWYATIVNRTDTCDNRSSAIVMRRQYTTRLGVCKKIGPRKHRNECSGINKLLLTYRNTWLRVGGSAGLPGWKTRFNSATDRVSAGYPAFIILDSLL